jgi:peptide/nickel transport system permease protein
VASPEAALQPARSRAFTSGRGAGDWQRAWHGLQSNPMMAAGLGVVGLWTLVAITGPTWSPYSPLQQDLVNRLAGPSPAHPFGTDQLGRDILSRVVEGARISLPVAVGVIAIATVMGSLVGAVAGFVGGWLDELLMRVVDAVLAFPAIVLAMAITAALGPGLNNAMLAMIVVWWPEFARLVRGQVLATKQLEHVTAARALGAGPLRLLARHIFVVCLGPVVVKATLDLGNVLIVAAALSFIGLGAVPPTPEWGAMISEGRTRFSSWWLATFPGLAIMTAVLAFNFVGDGLRDALDPRH